MRSWIRILLAIMAMSAVAISDAATIGKSDSPNCSAFGTSEIVEDAFCKAERPGAAVAISLFETVTGFD